MGQERPISRIDERFKTDHEFYRRLIEARSEYRLVNETVVEPFTGSGFRVSRGHSIRVALLHRPQVADIGLWAADDPSETISATRTQLLEGWFLRPHSRVWSDVPRLRPMATCLADSIGAMNPDSEFHHHYVGTHCAPEWIELRGGGPGKNACRVNLLQAIERFGMHESHIRDNINAHQKSRISADDGRLYSVRSDGGPGDHLELYAEIDLVVAISTCPNGDNTRYWSDPQDGVVSPLRVEIYDTGIKPKEFPRWNDWRRSWRGFWKPIPLQA